ncbi:hypothetical protein FQA39_LY09569 [Lamprigera yunnana]|nr:hypothetical protein FQA39_LY09569 [Lamprigera yunnana]
MFVTSAQNQRVNPRHSYRPPFTVLLLTSEKKKGERDRSCSNFTNSNAPVAKAPKLSNHITTEAVASCVASQQHNFCHSALPVSSRSASPQPIFLDTADYSLSIDVEDDYLYSSLPYPAPSSASNIHRKTMQSLQEPVAPKTDSFRTKREKEQQQLKNSLNQLTEVAVKAINKLNLTNWYLH